MQNAKFYRFLFKVQVSLTWVDITNKTTTICQYWSPETDKKKQHKMAALKSGQRAPLGRSISSKSRHLLDQFGKKPIN